MHLSSVIYLYDISKTFGYQLQYKEAEGSSYRDSPYETPGTPKVCFLPRGRPVLQTMRFSDTTNKYSYCGDQDRTFVPDSMSFGGDVLGHNIGNYIYSCIVCLLICFSALFFLFLVNFEYFLTHVYTLNVRGKSC